MTLRIPLSLLFPMIYRTGGIEWCCLIHLLSSMTYLWLFFLSYTTLSMHTDSGGTKFSKTATQCLISHHQLGRPRMSTIDCAGRVASILTIRMTCPLNWWPFYFIFVSQKLTFFFENHKMQPLPSPPHWSLNHYAAPPPLRPPLSLRVQGTSNQSSLTNQCYLQGIWFISALVADLRSRGRWRRTRRSWAR